MKKSLKILALICAIAAALSFSFTTALAGARTETVLEDSFSNSNLDGKVDPNKWNPVFTTETETIKQQDVVENPSLRFVKNQSGGEWIQYGTRAKISNIKSVSYSYMIPDGAKIGTWLGVTFAGALDQTKAGYYLYDAQLMLNDNVGHLKSVIGKWVSVKIIPTSDTAADVFYAFRKDDGTADFTAQANMTITGFDFDAITHNKDLTEEEKAQATKDKIEKEGWSFKNAYILWGCEGQGEGICIDDIKIVADDGGKELVYSNEFDSLDLDDQDSMFKAYECGRVASVALQVAEDNRMLFTKVKKGDRIISFAEIEKDTSVAEFVKCMDAVFTVQMDSDTQDAIAFAFGLDSEISDPIQNGCSYVIAIDENGDAYGKLVEYKDGKILNEQQEPQLLEKATGRTGVKMAITVYKNGSVVIKQNGTVISEDFTVEQYEGRVGFYAPKNNDGTVYVDNVIIDNTTYYVPLTKSVTHNFENDFFGNAGYEDFYVRPEGGTIEVQDGKLVWEGCSDFSYFGSAYEYDGFIMDYQITSVFVTDKTDDISATGPGRWMGLDISRARKTEHTYGSYATILFAVNPTDENYYPGIYTNDQSNLNLNEVTQIRYRPIPASLFEAIHYDNVLTTESQISPADAVCVRWVADPGGNSIKLYMKKYGEADFVLYYEAIGLNTTGYAMLTCTGYLTCKIDNFSMSNTSPIYEIANNEVPETIVKTETEYIYTKPDVDVNWEEELVLNGFGKKQDASDKGCKGSLAGGIIAIPLVLLAAVAVKRRRD